MSNIAKTIGVLALALFTLPMAGDQLKESHVTPGDVCGLQQAQSQGRVETSGRIQRVGRQKLITNGGCTLELKDFYEPFTDGDVYTVQGVLFGDQLQDVEISQNANSIALDEEGEVISTQRVLPEHALIIQRTCLNRRYRPAAWPLGCQPAHAYQYIDQEVIFGLSQEIIPHEGPTCAFFTLTADRRVATQVTLDSCQRAVSTR
jgi:hypothetical protein